MISPHERNIQLSITLDNWDQILEENDQIVRQLKDGMIVTEEEYLEIMNGGK